MVSPKLDEHRIFCRETSKSRFPWILFAFLSPRNNVFGVFCLQLQTSFPIKVDVHESLETHVSTIPI